MAETEFSDVRTLYSYTAQNSEEMSFESDMVLKITKKEDEYWWLAQHGAKTGLVPSNYVEEVILVDGQMENDSSPYADPTELLITKKNNSYEEVTEQKGKFYVLTKFVYKAQRDDELSFEANVILEVVSKSDSFQGWWKAKNKEGKAGLVPSNYVKEIASAYISPTSRAPDVFSFNDTSTTKNDENQNVILTKKKKADLLVERKNPFPANKAPEAKESLGVKLLTQQLITTEKSGTKRDPLDYKDEAWYFGKISRGDSELMLEPSAVGSFLIRDSESTKGNTSLSLKTPDCIRHYKVVWKNEKFVIGHRSFPTIPELIEYYKYKTVIYTAKSGQGIYLGIPYSEC